MTSRRSPEKDFIFILTSIDHLVILQRENIALEEIRTRALDKSRCKGHNKDKQLHDQADCNCRHNYFQWTSYPAGDRTRRLVFYYPSGQSITNRTLSKDIRYQREFGSVEAAAAEKQLVNEKAPLDKWVRESPFDSAKECENYKDNELKGRPNIDKYRDSDEYKKYKTQRNRLEAEEEESFKEMERILDESKELDENAKDVQREEIERFKLESGDRSKQSEAAFNLQMLARFAQGAARRCVPTSAVFVQKP